MCEAESRKRYGDAVFRECVVIRRSIIARECRVLRCRRWDRMLAKRGTWSTRKPDGKIRESSVERQQKAWETSECCAASYFAMEQAT
jgi:hypothetical protein